MLWSGVWIGGGHEFIDLASIEKGAQTAGRNEGDQRHERSAHSHVGPIDQMHGRKVEDYANREHPTSVPTSCQTDQPREEENEFCHVSRTECPDNRVRERRSRRQQWHGVPKQNKAQRTGAQK